MKLMSSAQVDARCVELFSCMSLMHAQGIRDDPADSRAFYGAVLKASNASTGVRVPHPTLPDRPKTRPPA